MGNRSSPRFAVLGAGHGGTAMAGHLSLMGFDVSLYNRGAGRLGPIQAAEASKSSPIVAILYLTGLPRSKL